MATFQGRGKCACCGAPVDVYDDKNGLAYYKCGPCGIKLTHSKAAKSRALLETIDRHADEDGAPPEKPQVPAPAPAKKPPTVPSAVTEKSGKTPEKSEFRLFGKR